ncbi:MAG: hypothetical protein ACTSUE_09795 [Promethearchaeota archaeon]
MTIDISIYTEKKKSGVFGVSVDAGGDGAGGWGNAGRVGICGTAGPVGTSRVSRGFTLLEVQIPGMF